MVTIPSARAVKGKKTKLFVPPIHVHSLRYCSMILVGQSSFLSRSLLSPWVFSDISLREQIRTHPSVYHNVSSFEPSERIISLVHHSRLFFLRMNEMLESLQRKKQKDRSNGIVNSWAFPSRFQLALDSTIAVMNSVRNKLKVHLQIYK